MTAGVNSQKWWDAYFKKGWKENHGSEQTEGFMALLVEALPEPELAFMKDDHPSILDWGCALGEGVSVLAEAFPDSEVVGADFSKVAIGRARRRYRKNRFLLTEDESLPEEFDVVVTSNCLEHFADPLAVVRQHLPSCRQLYIALVPYEESPLHEQHFAKLNEDSFPERLGGFVRIVNRVVPLDSELWTGDQLLVIYASPDYRGRADEVTMADVTPIEAATNPSGWARMAATTAAMQARHDARIDKVTARLEDLQSSHAAVRRELALRQRELDDRIRFAARAEAQVSDLEQRHAQLTGEVADRERRIETLRNDLTHKERDIDDAKRVIGEKAHWIIELERKIDQLVESRDGLAEEATTHAREYHALEVAHAELRHEVSDRERDLADVQTKLALRDASVMELEGQLDVSTREILQLGNAVVEARERITALERQRVEDKSELAVRDRALEAHLARVDELVRWSEALDAKLADRRNEVERLAAKLAQRSTELERVRDESEARSAELGLRLSELGEQLLAAERVLAEATQRSEALEQQSESLTASLEERIAYIESLEQLDAERAQSVAALEAEVLANQVVLEDQQIVLEEQANEAARLGAELGASRQLAAQRSAELNALELRSEAQHGDIERLEKALALANQRATEHAGEAHALFAQIDAIHRSTGWSVLQALMWVRYRIFPSGSWREKLGRRSMHVYRRAAYNVRRLPGLRRGASHALSSPSPSGLKLVEAEVDYSGWPLVSVILPVYNQADLLAESIDSVLAQDYPRFELIVLNDGSTDDVEAVLDRYVDDVRVRILTQTNQKLPKALSNAFELASGEYWTWTSADNIMEPRHLSALVDYLERNPSADMVYANYIAIDDRGEPLTHPDFRPHNRLAPDSPEIHLPHDTTPLGTVKDNFIGACFLYRGDIGRLIGEYDPQLGVEDYDYWMRINQHFEIHHLDSEAMLYRYRVHDNSLNARAADLGIFEAADNLIAYEAERTQAGNAPWRIAVDSAIADELAQLDCAPHSVERLEASLVAADSAEERTLLIVSSTGLAELDADTCAGFSVVVAWVGEDAEAIYENRLALSRLVDFCVVKEARNAARVRLFHDRVVVAREPARRFDLTLAFAKNEHFYRESRSQEDLARVPADVYRSSKHPRRLLIQIDVFAHGGMEQVILDQMICMRERGFEPMLATLEREGSARQATADIGVEVVSFEREGANRAEAYGRFLDEREIDLVISHLSLFGAEAAQQRGIPFVQVVHNTYVWFSAEQKRAYQDADRYTSAYVCVSAQAARYADLRLNLPPEKLVPLHNGIDTAHFLPADPSLDRRALRARLGLPDDRFIFLNVASLYAPKAQHEMISAMQRVRQEHPDALLVFAGHAFDPAFDAQVREQVSRLGLQGDVVFAGLQAEIVDYYHAADVFLLPSFWEGCSIALMEAALSGLPIIATRVGSAVDQFEGVRGVMLVDPPFGSITDLDCVNVNDCTTGGNPAFVRRIADAMIAVREDPTPVRLDAAARRSFDREVAYARHARFVDWIAQGGQVEGARAWLRAFDGASAPEVEA